MSHDSVGSYSYVYQTNFLATPLPVCYTLLLATMINMFDCVHTDWLHWLFSYIMSDLVIVLMLFMYCPAQLGQSSHDSHASPHCSYVQLTTSSLSQTNTVYAVYSGHSGLTHRGSP